MSNYHLKVRKYIKHPKTDETIEFGFDTFHVPSGFTDESFFDLLKNANILYKQETPPPKEDKQPEDDHGNWLARLVKRTFKS